MNFLPTILVPVSPGEGESWPNGVNATAILIYSVLKPKNEQDFGDIQEWFVLSISTSRSFNFPLSIGVDIFSSLLHSFGWHTHARRIQIPPPI